MPDAYSKPYETKEELARIFLSTTCTFFGISLGDRELEFLSYIILREKSLVSQLGKKLYRDKYNVSKQLVDNMISNLKKKFILIKENDKIMLHPNIALKFSDDNYIFQFRCRKITPTKTGDTLLSRKTDLISKP